MKILTIVGARPQFIKAAVISRAILQREGITEVIVHTGQHFDANMSDVFFVEMAIPKPKYQLHINGMSHGEMTGAMIAQLEPLIKAEDPDWVLLYGDTNSTLAGAIAARKLNCCAIAHFEAGLRNHDMTIPEEVNRIVTDRISDVLFCPSDLAIENLVAEGFDKMDCTYYRTGDLMYDAVIYYREKIEESNNILDQLEVRDEPFILCTVHRAHNTTAPGIYNLFEALNRIASSHKIVLPIHPRTRKALETNGIELHPNIIVIEPVGYIEMLTLMQGCRYVFTDSGGLQKEAYAMQRPCLTLIEYTPWQELVDGGYSVVTPIETESIIQQFEALQNLSPDYSVSLYGNGHSGEEVLDILMAENKKRG